MKRLPRDHGGSPSADGAAFDPPTPVRKMLLHPLTVGAVLTVVGLLYLAPLALIVLLYDGVAAIAAIAAASSAALWLVPLLRLGPLPWRWHALLALALGMGGLALLLLVLGCVGLLQRPLWVGLLGSFGVVGLARIALLIRQPPPSSPDEPPPPPILQWVTLLVIPFAVLALDVATVPPGFLWTPEGFGYDALIYHLQLPKEYLAEGRISYRPHNVYAGFPANVEMLFLLGMVLRGDAVEGVITAQAFNLAFAALTVFAVWVAAREWSRTAGIAAIVVMGTVAWLPYLCGVAFVENGLLFFGAVACAALIRLAEGSGFGVRGSVQDNGADNSGLRTQDSGLIIVAGLMCGLAAGCKYTGVTLVALPIGVAVLLMPARSIVERLKRGTLFAVAALATFSPWLIKNAVFTGNPVFPLASSVFDAYPSGWGPPEAAHFEECHRPLPSQRTLVGRLRELWRQVIANEFNLFGVITLAAPWLLLIAWFDRRRRSDGGDRSNATALLTCVLLVQLLAWLFGTHLYARFAIVLVLPLALMSAGALAYASLRFGSWVVASLMVIGTVLNLIPIGRLYRDHFYTDGARAALEGGIELFTRGPDTDYARQPLPYINRDLPADARILMLGDARAFYFHRHVDYCVVFNRNPFVEAIRANPDPAAIIGWLQERGYTHVLVNWLEIERLRRSAYGFPAEVNPDLFTQLASAGLRKVRTFDLLRTQRAYADLFEVPH